MSKSSGQLVPAADSSPEPPVLDKGYSPMTVRFFMLQSHFSSTLDFSNEALNGAEKALRTRAMRRHNIKNSQHPGTTGAINKS